MQKWEFKRVEVGLFDLSYSGIEDLKKLGKKGWELVAVLRLDTYESYYLKRPLEDSPSK